MLLRLSERGQDCVPAVEGEAGVEAVHFVRQRRRRRRLGEVGNRPVDWSVAFQRLGQTGEVGACSEGVRKTECKRIARAGAKPGQRKIDARMMGEPR